MKDKGHRFTKTRNYTNLAKIVVKDIFENIQDLEYVDKVHRVSNVETMFTMGVKI